MVISYQLQSSWPLYRHSYLSQYKLRLHLHWQGRFLQRYTPLGRHHPEATLQTSYRRANPPYLLELEVAATHS